MTYRELGRYWIASWILLLAFTVSPLQSQTQIHSYIFPGATSNTEVVIGNINRDAASVNVAFHKALGDISSTTSIIESGRQSRLNSVSAGVSDFNGTIVVTSLLPLAVSATQLEGDTPFDYMPPSDVSSELVIPFAPADSATLNVSIFNPGTVQANVKVVQIKQDGSQLDKITATVDPGHTNAVTLGVTAGVSHVIIRSTSLFLGDRPIAANAFIRSYTPPSSGAVQRNDFAVVTAVSASQATATTNLPFFAQGNDYFSVVQFVNLSDAEQTVKITARQPDGTNIAASSNPASITIPAFGATRKTIAEMFNPTATGLITGSLVAEGSGPILGAVAIGTVSQPGLTVLRSENQALTNFAYQIRRTGREFFTGLSFKNDSDRDADVALYFLTDEGTNVSMAPVAVRRGQQVLGQLSELFPEAQGSGYIFVRSSAPLLTTGIDGRTSAVAFAARQPLYASADFVVPAQQRYLAVGTVRDQTVGISGVAVRLSGPVESSTLSDAAGTFVFRDLPPGNYSLTPIPLGYTVSPEQHTFVITDANSRNNDFNIGLILPKLDRLTPDGVVVNSGSTVVTVDGRDFITGSVVVFESTELPTTYITSTQLVASIDSSLLTYSGDVPLRVRSKGPSGSYVDSQALPFTVGNSGPVLTSITGQPNPLIAASVTTAFTITVNGAGFTPASQVKVNRVGRVTTFISTTQLRAVVLPSDVAAAGYVPIVVQNPGSVTSQAFQLPVMFPVPRMTSVTPDSITAQVALDAQPVQLSVTGEGFYQDSNDASITTTVLVDNLPVSTQYITSRQLIAFVPANLVAHSGVRQVAVKSPEPSVSSSDALPLFISNPAPVVTSLNAGPISYNSTQTETIWLPVAINGSNFSEDSVAWVNPPCDTNGFRRAQTTIRVSSNQIIATIPIRCSGSYQLQVRTPQPGGGVSAPLTLSVAASSSSSLQD